MRSGRISIGAVVVSILLLIILGLAVRGAVASWRLAGTTRMSVHGYIAMALAGGLSGLLAAGLIALALYSARRGYDDDQGEG